MRDIYHCSSCESIIRVPGMALLLAPGGGRPQLQRLLADRSAVVRLRALALLAALAARGAAQASAVHASGMSDRQLAASAASKCVGVEYTLVDVEKSCMWRGVHGPYAVRRVGSMGGCACGCSARLSMWGSARQVLVPRATHNVAKAHHVVCWCRVQLCCCASIRHGRRRSLSADIAGNRCCARQVIFAALTPGIKL